MEVCDIILFFENVDPNVDIDLIHKVFSENDMDVLIAMGNLEQGQLVLDVSAYETNMDDAAMKSIHIAEELLGENKLTKVTSSKSEVPEEYNDENA